MKFIGVRDLRSRTSGIWKELKQDKEMVITSNGKPVALLTSVDEEGFKKAVKMVRRARAMCAVEALHKQSLVKGSDKLPVKAIAEEIAKVRLAK